jgi:uncharacterized protein YndB with AHSA1/START domain
MGAQDKRDRSGTRGYAHLVEISAPVGRVWRALTDPSLIRIWYKGDAEVDARKGGLYRLGTPRAGGREAHIDIFEPNRRLRLIYQQGPRTPASDSAVVDDFLLDVRRGKTTLRLLGSGVPEAEAWDHSYVRMRIGWERLLARMRVMLENPPPAKAIAHKPRAPAGT